jgi:hypothetical protein
VSQIGGPPVAQPVNSLAIAGFVCSLVGLASAGLLSPIGLILSIVALGREPKGFAIAGVVIGALGTCGALVGLIFLGLGAAILAALGIAVVATAVSEPQRTELTVDGLRITLKIEEHRGRTGGLPATLEELGLPGDLLLDPWGNRYRYELTGGGTGYRVMTDGPDGEARTGDDLDVRDFQKLWEDAGQRGQDGDS